MENRLRLIRKKLNYTQEVLAEELGIGKSALSMIETGRAALSERNKNIIVKKFNINQEWIDTGVGEMFNSQAATVESPEHYESKVFHQSVPLYSIEGTAGLVPLFLDKSKYKPIDYIYIPNLPKCDGAIYIVGDNMYPLLKSGDIVLYKQINSTQNIFLGDMYLLSIDLDGDEYIVVQYVQRSDREGFVRLVSQNPHHADKDIEISRIKALALVKASVRMNSIR